MGPWGLLILLEEVEFNFRPLGWRLGGAEEGGEKIFFGFPLSWKSSWGPESYGCFSHFHSSKLGSVEIFAKVPYLQHYYDTGCMEEGSSVLERVAEVRSSDDSCLDECLAAAEMFWVHSGNALGSAKGLGLRLAGS